MDVLRFAALKEQHRAERERYPHNLTLRVHRALSWLQKAEQEEDCLDSCFIFLWIALNAAYATEISDRQVGEQEAFNQFISKLCQLDNRADQQLANFIWHTYPGPIRVLLGNEYAFRDFWLYQAGLLEEEQWKENFKKASARALRALSNKETDVVLGIVFSRLYVLRNQLIHGGATFQSQVNRGQLKDGVTILQHVVPRIIKLMMDNPQELWGDAAYPVVNA